MKTVFKTFLILISFICQMQSYASSVQEELYWFKNVLQFSKLNPDQLDEYMNPLVGKTEYRLSAKHAPWAGNYFPMDQGGAANRWQNCKNNTCQVYSKDEIQKMTVEEISHLSPIEKYDLLVGDYSFGATHHELINRGPRRMNPPEYWEGFCNGIRCAGLILNEPKFPVTIKNKDGIEIRFEPADIKALAGVNYFYVEKYGQLGGPTNFGLGTSQPNAAVFDITLRFHLGHHKKGFVIDSHLGPEIWNETVVGFKRELSEEKKLSSEEKRNYPKAVRKFSVNLTLETLGEVEIQASNGPTKSRVSQGDFLTPLNAGYDLFVDSKGRLIDGAWHPPKDSRGVDFAWFARGRGADDKYAFQGGNELLKFEKLNPLFKQSVRPICSQVLKF